MAEYQDKRVDNIIRKKGYEAIKIFYSPLKVWLTYLMMFLFLIGVPLLIGGAIFDLLNIILKLKYFILTYIVIAYLFQARFNNNIAFTGNECLIINPNIPFRYFKEIKVQQIEMVTIDKDAGIRILGWIFGWGSGNYIIIKTKDQVMKYYCLCLEEDYVDENLTQLTMDDLHSIFREKEIPVRYNLD